MSSSLLMDFLYSFRFPIERFMSEDDIIQFETGIALGYLDYSFSEKVEEMANRKAISAEDTIRWDDSNKEFGSVLMRGTTYLVTSSGEPLASKTHREYERMIFFMCTFISDSIEQYSMTPQQAAMGAWAVSQNAPHYQIYGNKGISGFFDGEDIFTPLHDIKLINILHTRMFNGSQQIGGNNNHYGVPRSLYEISFVDDSRINLNRLDPSLFGK